MTHNQVILIGIAVWVVMVAIVIFFNYACSKVSGNDTDPHRDEDE